MGRQDMWRFATGTVIFFPLLFTEITSTTLFSSFAPSPRQIYIIVRGSNKVLSKKTVENTIQKAVNVNITDRA